MTLPCADAEGVLMSMGTNAVAGRGAGSVSWHKSSGDGIILLHKITGLRQIWS